MEIEMEVGGSKAVWAVRFIWIVLALVVLGYLATMTEGNAVSVPDKPLISTAAFAGLLISYPALKKLLVTRQGTISGSELLFLSDHRVISGSRLWVIRLLLAIWFLGTLTATSDSSPPTQSAAEYMGDIVMGGLFLSAVVYWLVLRIVSVNEPETNT